MTELFTLGDNYMVTLNKTWISTIPEFRAILARDKGGPTDGSGRFKKQATREFTYIFHMYDFRSPFENYKAEERVSEVEEMTGITAGDVEKDEALQAAIARYKDLLDNCSPTLRGLRTLKSAVDKMWDYFEDVDYAVADIKKVQDSINNMPKTQETIKKLEDLVKMEMAGDTGMRGDAEKGVEEDPEYD